MPTTTNAGTPARLILAFAAAVAMFPATTSAQTATGENRDSSNAHIAQASPAVPAKPATPDVKADVPQVVGVTVDEKGMHVRFDKEALRESIGKTGVGTGNSDSVARLNERIRDLERAIEMEREAERPYHRKADAMLDFSRAVIMALILGCLAIGLRRTAPAATQSVTTRLTAGPVRSLLVGFSALVVALPAFVIGLLCLVLSIIGIPLVIAWIPFYFFALFAIGIVGCLGAIVAVGSRYGRAEGAWYYRPEFTGAALLLAPVAAGALISVVIRPLGTIITVFGSLYLCAVMVAGFGAALMATAEWVGNSRARRRAKRAAAEGGEKPTL